MQVTESLKVSGEFILSQSPKAQNGHGMRSHGLVQIK